ncbi:hypothetical protein BH23ACT10_BH23ACT10_36720 [soil metagenome]
MNRGSVGSGRVVIALLASGVVLGFAALATLDAVRGGPALRRVGVALGVAEPTIAHSVVVRDDDGPRLELTEGTATLADVARLAAAGGHDGLLVAADDGWLLRAQLSVLAGARLDVGDTILRIADRGIESRGGHIVVVGSQLVGWDLEAGGAGAPDVNPADGRAWLVARDGGQMEIVDSHLRYLGYDEVGRTGATWLGVDSGGRVTGSTIAHVHTGIALHEVRSLSIAATEIRATVRDGVLQEGGGPVSYDALTIARTGRDGVRFADARGGEVTAVTVVGARGSGFELRDGTVGVGISGSEVRDGARAGVLISGTQGVTLRDSDVYGNRTGVVVEDDAARTRIIDNRIAANRREGLFVRDRAAQAVVRGNRIDLNGRAGLALVGADVEVTANWLEQNADGIRIGEDEATGGIVDNQIVDNIEDGVDLPEQPTLTVAGNLIADNRRGAFSVLSAGRSDPVAADNTLRDNGDGQERIREP